jgi:hypothetical protein
MTTGKPIAWAVDGSIQQVDELKESAIQALEQLESIMSEAAFRQRYDVLHNVVKTFAMLNSVIVSEARQRWQSENPGMEA